MPFRLRTFGGLSLTGESGPVTGAAAQRRKLALLAVGATERREHRRAVEWWRRLAALDPYSSQIVSGLMRALIAVGDSAGALRQAEIHATLLREELHMEPDETVLAIVRQIHIS